MVSDLNKGISEIAYNSLNLPARLSINNSKGSATNHYLYSADGAKLQVNKLWSNTMREQTDYVGNMIYENNALKRILVDGGYVEDGNYYFYETDHLGNNRVVMNDAGLLVQTNDYYPYGMSFAEGLERSKQPYKYNGKEFDAERGLNLYDYSARFMDPALGRFTTADPLAEKSYSVSPYAYCNNNPILYIDPDGRAWRLTYDEDHDGNRTYNGYEWVPEDQSYDADGNLLSGLYSQAIFFSNNGNFDPLDKWNIGSSTATVYLADGTTTTFKANTNPSSNDYATIPEGTYHATVGLHQGNYPAHPIRTYAEGINIHKSGLKNLTGLTKSGSAVSQGCLLIDRYNWSNFIGNFNTDTQRANTVSVTVSRSLVTPINVTRLPAFNFYLNGTRSSFFSSFKW